MSASLVGSEMCIRDSSAPHPSVPSPPQGNTPWRGQPPGTRPRTTARAESSSGPPRDARRRREDWGL
eukprot:3732480-Alexandrium_andersonii.AAC.1